MPALYNLLNNLIMKQERKDSSTATASNSPAQNTGTVNQAKDNSQNKNTADKKTNEDSVSLLEVFFNDQLKDIYFAEKLIQKNLPKMQEAATTEELKEAFEDHLHQTTKQIKRLEKVFQLMDKKAESEKCDAMEGIIKECEKIIKDTKEGSMTRDAALIIAAQKIEHYEIATYGGLVQLAITIGQQEVAELLDKSLMEEEDTDKLLTNIAEGNINMEAEEEKAYSATKKKSLASAGVENNNGEQEDDEAH